MKNLIAIPFLLLSIFGYTQDAEDHVGAWYMYFGTNRVSEKLSIHTEAQMRLYEPAANFNQFLPRVGLNFHHGTDITAISTLGYALIPTSSFAKDSTQMTTLENRIFEQFITRAKYGSRQVGLEHRYRLEQRWIAADGVETVLRHRARYRILVTLPFYSPEAGKGPFLALYDEIFIDIDTTPFDQNRLYAALGYQFNKNVNLQAGYLYHRAGSADLSRFQLGLTFNTDLRK